MNQNEIQIQIQRYMSLIFEANIKYGILQRHNKEVTFIGAPLTTAKLSSSGKEKTTNSLIGWMFIFNMWHELDLSVHQTPKPRDDLGVSAWVGMGVGGDEAK